MAQRGGRRLLVLQVASVAGSAVAVAAALSPGAAQADSDPGDPAGQNNRPRGTNGGSDRDPGDSPGRGRAASRPYGGSDSDPSDQAGRGRGPRQSNVSDRDPGDSPGRGRGGYR
jgi:hypothetical protein